jgi:hypothetical protein
MNAIDIKNDELVYKLLDEILTSSVAYKNDLVLDDSAYMQLLEELQSNPACPPVRRLQDHVSDVIDTYKDSDKYWWAVHNATQKRDFNTYDLYGKEIN